MSKVARYKVGRSARVRQDLVVTFVANNNSYEVLMHILALDFQFIYGQRLHYGMNAVFLQTTSQAVGLQTRIYQVAMLASLSKLVPHEQFFCF